MPNDERILFNIPGCFITAEFIKYKKSNDKWRYCLINNNNNKRKLITRSLNNEVMTKVIEDLIKRPEDNKTSDFNKSYQNLKDKVEVIKIKIINN